MNQNPNPLEPLTSHSLVQGVKEMNDDAWRRFMEVYLPVIYSRCRSFGLPKDVCAELAQEAVVKIARSIGGFHFPGDEIDNSAERTGGFRHWLRTVTANTVRDYLRRERRRCASWDPTRLEAISASFFSDDFADRIPSDTISAEFPHGRSECTDLVAAALRARRKRVKEHNWQAFWRTAIEGKSDTIVAAELQMTSRAVRQARFETIRELRVHLSCLMDVDEQRRS